MNTIQMENDQLLENSSKNKKWTCCTKTMLALTGTLWAGWAVARFTIGGSCSRPDLAENFEKPAFLGRWYQAFVGSKVGF